MRKCERILPGAGDFIYRPGIKTAALYRTPSSIRTTVNEVTPDHVDEPEYQQRLASSPKRRSNPWFSTSTSSTPSNPRIRSHTNHGTTTDPSTQPHSTSNLTATLDHHLASRQSSCPVPIKARSISMAPATPIIDLLTEYGT